MIRFTAALVIVLALGATVPAIAVDAERPVYSVGDTWGLADATYRLARVEKNVYVFTAEGDREIRLTRELGVSLVRHGGEAIELTPPPKVPWPLRVGKWGSQTVFVRLRGETSGAADAWLTWRVEAQEPVTAGGRTLDAFRIRYTVSAERPTTTSSFPTLRSPRGTRRSRSTRTGRSSATSAARTGRG